MVLGMIAAAGPAFALEEPEFPGQSDSLPSDIEPPLLSQNLALGRFNSRSAERVGDRE